MSAPEAREVVIRHDSCPPPSVALIGVGGCGINLTRRVMNTSVMIDGVMAPLGQLVDFHNYLDTSRANLYGSERVSLFSKGDGSGKIRKTNADEIRRNIPTLTPEVIGSTDIVILVFGCSGGTGSVMGPLLIQELVEKEKTVIFVGSADATSEIDCKNTKACLKTIHHLTQRDDLYLPTILAQTETDRTVADQYLLGQTVGLVEILKREVREIDRNDRLNWLNASRTMSCQPGMHPLYVLGNTHTEADDVEDLANPALAADSALYLGATAPDGSRVYERSPVQLERFRKDGVLITEPGKQAPDPMVGILMSTSKTLETILDAIETKLRAFMSQGQDTSNKVSQKLAVSEDDPDILL